MDASLIYFPSAVILGALHALEPGHAKTLTAAFLIGTKGTKRDATLLGLSVAFTHSLIVVGICLIALFLGRQTFAGEAAHYLAVGSSILVIGLGSWLLRRRLRSLARANELAGHSHSHAPDPIKLKGNLFDGIVEIIDTANGERFRVTSNTKINGTLTISINRPNSIIEMHDLIETPSKPGEYLGVKAPEEPHEFAAALSIRTDNLNETIQFEMHEPEHHHHHHEHDHALLSDEEHAKAHAATLPDYVGRGERPSPWQIMAFGAAGGLMPCPAAISVMLLALSLNETGKGLILVLGFGIGLAVSLVGVGLLIVTGVSKLASTGRFSKLSAYAPLAAAAMVIVSGLAGLLIALFNHYHV